MSSKEESSEEAKPKTAEELLKEITGETTGAGLGIVVTPRVPAQDPAVSEKAQSTDTSE